MRLTALQVRRQLLARSASKWPQVVNAPLDIARALFGAIARAGWLAERWTQKKQVKRGRARAHDAAQLNARPYLQRQKRNAIRMGARAP